MPFDPEHLESEPGISAVDDVVETVVEHEFSSDAEGHEDGVVAQAHTVKVGSVG